MLDLADYQAQARLAVQTFWGNRAAARTQQAISGMQDQGERSGVTAGKNMEGFADLMAELVVRNGLPATTIHRNKLLLTLPGYFRPTKSWDMLVIHQGRLVAALEFKSQVGPSFGNNFNNRTEEAMGTAIDLWTAYREGAFGDTPRPFVGWLMLVEDCPASRVPLMRDQSRHFKIFPEFQGTSYADRYSLFCRKLVQEQLYSTAALLVSPRDALETGLYSELSDLTSLSTFVTSFAGHIAAEAARTSH
jgi:hypothetical protein